ncbi:RxLR effector protein [Phytophthora megakarya]|uniref:RxLR effector protein n=1 Tax=Phytophthora megakarya TaxID=4795 RepID=A0A225WJS9_9STRA|nr:RxLR effector protein [Phytophthora megakarya]
MRLSYFLMAAISTLSIHEDPVTASVGSEVALTGIVSLGFLHLVDADHSVSDQPRFLRGNNIAESEKEERGFTFGDIEKMVNQVKSMKTFNKLNSVQKAKLSTDADGFMRSAFKFVDDVNMSPHDLETQLKTMPDVSDAFRKTVVDAFTNHLKEIGK